MMEEFQRREEGLGPYINKKIIDSVEGFPKSR